MTNDQLEKLRQVLSDFYKVVYWTDPFNADEFMKKKIEELGGRTRFLSGTDKYDGVSLSEKFLGRPLEKRHRGFTLTGFHQDDTGIYIMHASHACCILDEEIANKILVLGMPGEYRYNHDQG